MNIPFNRTYLTGKEIEYISKVVLSGDIKGDGPYTKKCQQWVEQTLDVKKVLLTNSCTAALEMAALLCQIEPGDEVILPSFTFVSTANAFVLFGARPVFIDIRRDTLNIDEQLIEEKITEKTKYICPVHYGGVACNMTSISAIAKKHNLLIVEDAASAMLAKYKDKYLGTIGDIGTFSFHETKNCSSGEGGAILINRDDFVDRAEIIREKGTDRSRFFRGEVEKYSWIDVGSNYLPSEIIAAFLYAQIEHAHDINKRRQYIWQKYRMGLDILQDKEKVQLPGIPSECEHNAHLFYLLLQDETTRDRLMTYLREAGIWTVFHYLPLQSSVMGKKFGYSRSDCPVSVDISGRLLRLPFFNALTESEQDYIIVKIKEFFA
jgi:dTDP-4-amino-4,6-dideoxygalactose transaminase